jgi:hypothetical protein
MWFLLRMIFWLVIVLVCLPNVGSQPMPKSQVSAGEAVRAAKVVVADRPARTTGSVPVPRARPSQHTLQPTDLVPPWRGPQPADTPRDKRPVLG